MKNADQLEQQGFQMKFTGLEAGLSITNSAVYGAINEWTAKKTN